LLDLEVGAARRLSVDISPGVVGREDALAWSAAAAGLTDVSDAFGMEPGFVVPVELELELELAAPVSIGFGFMFKSRLVLKFGLDAFSFCCIIGLELDVDFQPCITNALTGLLPILNGRD
jgi:hypothetical protein